MHRPIRTATLLLLLAAATHAADPGQNPWFRDGRAAVARARTEVGTTKRARNVILFVGDGMGIATVTAARIRQGQLRGGTGEENFLAFERLPFTALSKTYNTDYQVPDSAGTITAMLTGVKTRAGVLGIDDSIARGDFAGTEAASVPTLLERAEDAGLWTGVVTTTTVTHATPAGTYAHTPDRDWEGDAKMPEAARAAGFPDIARQLVESPHGDGPEIVLGGGRAFFQPTTAADPEYPERTGTRLDGRDLVGEWQAKRPGSAYVWNREGLLALDLGQATRVLGLFEPSHMQFEDDRARDAAGEPSLSEMTAAAITLLSRAPKGYFLLVEGGRIDHGHHASNAHRALGDTIELSNAVRVALEKTQGTDTLIVVTADHSHTLSMAGYPRRGNPILGLVSGSSGEGGPSPGPAKDLTGKPYTTLSYANGPGYPGASDSQPEGPKTFPHPAKSFQGVTRGRPDLTHVDTTAPGYLQEATVPLGSETHGGEDVVVWAGGPSAALFHGTREQSYVYHVMAAALGLDR
ncbi:MAG: alkaline phosphatase [bacterium]|nr:alkaline phosphatase [bacterium]